MAINANEIAAYIEKGKNVLITGEAGTGKTAIVTEAVNSLGAKMKYFSAPTLDPFVHLIGIPVPDQINKRLEWFQDETILDVEYMFFDEVNRASDQVINAIFEITQFKTLNGTPLPNLKAVIGALNPVTDDYEGNEELDMAFVDRFDFYLESEVVCDFSYFTRKFGKDMAKVAISLFDSYEKSRTNPKKSTANKIGYLSPRRMEKVVSNYMLFPSADTIRRTLPSDVTLSAATWAQKMGEVMKAEAAKKAQNGSKVTVSGTPKSNPNINGADAVRTVLSELLPDECRKAENYDTVVAAYEFAVNDDMTSGTNNAAAILDMLADALSVSVGVKKFEEWKDIVSDMTPAQKSKMMSRWPATKKMNVETILNG